MRLSEYRHRFARTLSRLWFRTLRVEGLLPEGAVLLVLNHPNGLLDAVVVTALLDPPPRFLAKATLWKLAPLRPLLSLFDPIPVARAQDGNDEKARTEATSKAFRAVHESFAQGHRVGLFPEGISHGNADLAPLKTGAARMVLSSALMPRLVPAGLIYGRRDLFRHNVLLRLGEPISFDDLQGHGDEATTVLELTNRIRAALLPLTLHGPEETSLRLAEELAWLLADSAPDRADLDRHRSHVQVLQPRLAGLSDEDRNVIRAKVQVAKDQLEKLGLRPDQVGHPYDPSEVRHWIPRALIRHLAALPCAPATLLFWPPYRLVGWMADHFTDELDQTATYKLVGGALLMPLWTALLAGLGAWLWGWLGAGLALAAAMLAFLAFPLMERLPEDWQAIRGFRQRRHPEVAGLIQARKELLEAFPDLQT